MKVNVKKILSLAFVCMFTFLVAFTGYKPAYRVYAADEDFTPSPSPVIVEQFTGGWCGYCPYACACIDLCDTLLNQERDVFINLAYHSRDGLATSDTTKRSEVYNVTSWPWLQVEGVEKMQLYGSGGVDLGATAGMYQQTIEQYDASKYRLADIQLTADYDSHSFHVKVKAKQDFGKRKINILAAIYEDWVNLPLRNGMTFNRHTVRKMPYGTLGKPLRLKEGQIYDEVRKFVLITKASEQCGVVVFLQDQDSKEIVGSALYKFATTPKSLFYWNEPQLGTQEKHTCLDTMTFKASGVNRLKKVFVSVDTFDEYYSVEGALLSESLEGKATLDFNSNKNEVIIEFNSPYSGSTDLFELLIHFKKDTGDGGVVFPLNQFIAVDDDNNSLYYELLNMIFFTGIKVLPNLYDLDENGTINNGDVSFLTKTFGTERGDKGFEKTCDFNGDRRIDLEDLNVLMLNEDWRIEEKFNAKK